MSENIGGSKDEFFRYKMPDIEVKIEGRGNGIKTVIPNMADIGLALKRDPTYPTKFFATELGALSQWDAKRNVGIVNGEHSKDRLKQLLADFINRYVLCPQCHLPETDLRVKNNMIHAKCAACGWRGPSDNQHKLATYILNHPPKKEKEKGDKNSSSKKDKEKDKEKDKKKSKPEKSSKKEKEDKVTEQTKDEDGDGDSDSDGVPATSSPTDQTQEANAEQNENPDKEDDGEIHFEITPEMEKVVGNEHAELDDPVEQARVALELVAGKSVEEQTKAVQDFQKQHGFSTAEVFQYVFKALVTDSMTKQVKANLKLLSAIKEPGRGGQVLILSLIEERCEAFPTNLKFVCSTLGCLYDADVMEEETLLSWHQKGNSQLVALADDAASLATRKSADKFVEWLQTAEEE